jgi:GntR family transcriptional regulator
MLLFELNPSDDRPIFAQIMDRVKCAVAAGVLRPGEMVPSVRELSKQLVINPNTVARAYRDLQAEGLLEPVRGTGLQVDRRGAGAVPGRAAGDRPAAVAGGDGGGAAQRDGPGGGRGDDPPGVGQEPGRGGAKAGKSTGRRT